ncbi:MAG: lamin tail domain-containing protein [Leptospirales bacterium]
MRYIIQTFIITAFCFSCANSPFPSGDYVKLHAIPGEGDPLVSLIKLAGGVQKNLRCALSDIEIPLPYFDYQKADTNPGLVTYSKKQIDLINFIKKLIRLIQDNIHVQIVTGVRPECASSGFLALQYPFLLDPPGPNPVNFRQVYEHCITDSTSMFPDPDTMPGVLPENSPWVNQPSPFQENQNLYFVNSTGVMRHNYCVADENQIWISSTPPAVDKAPALAIEVHSGGLGNFLNRETDRLIAGLTGKWKPPGDLKNSFKISDVTLSLFLNPQSDPLDKIANSISRTEKTRFLASRFDSTVGNIDFLSKLSAIAEKEKLSGLFYFQPAFVPESIYMNLFSETACPGSPRCPDNAYIIHTSARSPFTAFLNENSKQNNFLLFTDEISTKTKYNDSLLLVVENDRFYEKVLSWYNRILLRSYHPASEPGRVNPGEIIVNEILWQGSIDNSLSRKTTDEFMELKNLAGRSVDLTGWSFACTTDGISASTFYSFPVGSRIEKDGFLTISATTDKSVPSPDLVSSDLAIRNSTLECILTDGDRTDSNLLNHYADSRINGTIVDRVLSTEGPPLNEYSSHYFSRTGFNSLKYNMESDGARSIERVAPDGSLFSSWQTNAAHFSENRFVDLAYALRTFATPGSPNTTYIADNYSGIYISEIHWMGSYDQFGTSTADDEFIEIHNSSTEPINIGGLVFGCSSSATGDTGKPLFGIPYNTLLQPGEKYLINRSINGAFNTANYYVNDFSLSNLNRFCILTDGDPTALVFEGSDGVDANANLNGHFDHSAFRGNIIDRVGNYADTLANQGIGLNDTVLKIRRSAERLFPPGDGSNPLNWLLNPYDAIANIYIPEIYKYNTFASPGY